MFVRKLFSATADTGGGSDKATGSQGADDKSAGTGAQSTDASQEQAKGKENQQTGAAKDSPSDKSATEENLTADEIAQLKADREELARVRKEAAERRKTAQEELRKNGEFQKLLTERETELAVANQSLTGLKAENERLKKIEKLWNDHEVKEKENLLGQLPETSRNEYKNSTLDEIRRAVKVSKESLATKSQGSGGASGSGDTPADGSWGSALLSRLKPK